MAHRYSPGIHNTVWLHQQGSRHDDGEHRNDKCVIVGSSTPNERIEHLWRDFH